MRPVLLVGALLLSAVAARAQSDGHPLPGTREYNEACGFSPPAPWCPKPDELDPQIRMDPPPPEAQTPGQRRLTGPRRPNSVSNVPEGPQAPGSGTGGEPAGCGAAAKNPKLFNLGKAGPAQSLRMPPGTVASSVLPPANKPRHSGEIWITEASTSPNGRMLIEVTISRCKGLIDPKAGRCYMRSEIPHASSIVWVEATTKDVTKKIIDQAGNCFAPAASGVWYFNIRYDYDACNVGPGNCGETITWYDSWM